MKRLLLIVFVFLFAGIGIVTGQERPPMPPRPDFRPANPMNNYPKNKDIKV